MQGYKVKEKTAIVPHCTPSFKTQWAEQNQVPPTRLILMRTSVTRGLILIFKIYD
jgi:hypothetical protein